MKLLVCFGPLFKRNEDKKRLQQTRALYAISFKSKAAHVGDGVEEDAAADESIRKKHAVRKKSGSLDPAIVMQLESQLGDGWLMHGGYILLYIS